MKFLKIAAICVSLVCVLGCYDDPKINQDGHPCSACKPCEECIYVEAIGPRCVPKPNKRTECKDGHVHSFDHCGDDEGIVEECPLNAECVDTGAFSAECRCRTHWEGAKCDVCPGRWNPAADCASCVGHWVDNSNNCNTCPGNWDRDSDCMTCKNHWQDHNNNCGTCPANWDPKKDCNECLPNWDIATDCETCEGRWTGSDCETCPTNWDPAQDCDACLGNWDPASDCETCMYHWENNDDNCGTCPDNWDPAQDCDACLGRWDRASDCETCMYHWENNDDNCGTCPDNWNPANSCNLCRGNWDLNTNCTECENAWEDNSDNCGTCPSGYDSDDDCAPICGDSVFHENAEDCDDNNDVSWDGCDDCSIVEFKISDDAPSTEVPLSVALGADGGFIIAWGFANDIFAQRFDSDCNEIGSQFLLNTHTSGVQDEPVVAIANDGGFVAVWESEGQDGSGEGVSRRRFDKDGVGLESDLQTNTYVLGDQHSPSVDVASDGDFVIVWTNDDSGNDDSNIHGRHFNSNGAMTGSEFTVNTTFGGSQHDPHVAMIPGGGFVVVWDINAQDTGSDGIRGQRFDSDGTKLGDEFDVNTISNDIVSTPSVATFGDDSFVVVWEDQYEIYGQRFDANGDKAGSKFQADGISGYTCLAPQVAAASDGGFVVIWRIEVYDDVYIQRFNAGGDKVGSEALINENMGNSCYSPNVAMAADGRAVLAWTTDNGIYAQRFDADGNPRGVAPW